MPLINAHADVCSKARCLDFGLNLHLYPYFMYASSKSSGESVHAQTRLSIRCSLIRKFIEISCAGLFLPASLQLFVPFLKLWTPTPHKMMLCPHSFVLLCSTHHAVFVFPRLFLVQAAIIKVCLLCYFTSHQQSFS